MTPRVVLIAAALAAAAACNQPVNTVPAPVSPTAAVQYYDLDVPADVEIRAVDFSATAFAETTGSSGGVLGSAVGGRAFVKVYAVRRGTGEQLLLLYEDIARRRQPVQVIRFHAGAPRAAPDSAR